MHKRQLIALAILVGPALVTNACSGSDSDFGGADGSGGASGASGAGGSAGTADGGGTGGSAGKAGGGGTSGSAGKAGSGGAAGSAGKGGSAGATIDGGTGGSAGTAGSGGASGKGGAAGTSDGSTGDARSETSSDVRNGLPCSSGPAMDRDCGDYCGDWFDVCEPIAMWATTYADEPACLAACRTWPDAKLCCRAEHADNATNANNMTEVSMHCGHAVGVNGPAACNN